MRVLYDFGKSQHIIMILCVCEFWAFTKILLSATFWCELFRYSFLPPKFCITRYIYSKSNHTFKCGTHHSFSIQFNTLYRIAGEFDGGIKFDEFTFDDTCIKLNSINIKTFMKAIVEMTNLSNYNLSILVICILTVNCQI